MKMLKYLEAFNCWVRSRIYVPSLSYWGERVREHVRQITVYR